VTNIIKGKATCLIATIKWRRNMDGGESKAILIVEDETILRESLRDWLADGGYQVETAEEGEAALKFITERDFDLVLLDLKLPGKDGIEVLRQARAMKPKLRVIIITAYPSIQTAVRAIKEGAVDYLPKPFDLNDLEKLIQGTLKSPAWEKNDQDTSEMAPTLAVVKDDEGLSVTLTGWEYIDAYLGAAERK
jgi:DNA-binding NtrC family response regulator